MAKTTEVATKATVGEVVEFTALDKIAALAHMTEENPTAVVNSMVERVMTLGADNLFKQSSTVSSDDFIDVPFLARDILIRESKYESSPFYASIDAMSLDGEMIVVNTSSPTVASKVLRAKELGILPKWLKITQKDKPTKAGYYPVDVVEADPAEVVGKVVEASFTPEGEAEPF